MDILVVCDYCGFAIPEDEACIGEDGDKFYCSTDCRSSDEHDKAIARAESRSDWI